jgi:hypothetical protein
VSIKDRVGWALLQQALSCVLAHIVAELDDTPLYFTDDTGIVFGPPMEYSSMFSRGRRH